MTIQSKINTKLLISNFPNVNSTKYCFSLNNIDENPVSVLENRLFDRTCLPDTKQKERSFDWS